MEYVKKNLNWDTIVKETKEIANQVNERGFEPDVIIPILRGGMYPAGLLSDLLNVKHIYPIIYSNYNGMIKKKRSTVEPFNYSIRDMNVLIVDDILDTGDTFEAVMSIVKRSDPKRMMTASLWVRENSTRPSFWSSIAKENEWLIFPWELVEFEGV